MLPSWWIDFIVCLLAAFWQPNYKRGKSKPGKYGPKVGMIPDYAFSLVWTALYTTIAFSMFNYLQHTTEGVADTYNRFDAVVILIIVNLALSKLWCPLYFGAWGYIGRLLALFDNVILLGLNITIVVLMYQQGAMLALKLWSAYLALNAFSIFLNIMTLGGHKEKGELYPWQERLPKQVGEEENDYRDDQVPTAPMERRYRK